jgi:Arc/MetJ-type ribon-helix-helix transcriptional regulator
MEPQQPLVVPKFGMAKGGQVSQTKRMLEDGGMLQEGGTVDPVSGNKVPVGSMQEEVRDDVPAQLSEGEFVFPADVVRYIGLERLMQMRQAAKAGLKQMEEMGQMSNGEDATEEEDTSEFESELDEIMGEVDNEVKMAEGGAVMPSMSQPQQAPAPMNLEATQAQAAAPVPPTPAPTSNAPEMSVSQIIKQDMQGAGFTEDKKQVVNTLMQDLAVDKAMLIKQNNTAFIAVAEEPGVLTIHTFTADEPAVLAESASQLVELLKKSGIRRITSEVKDPSIITALQDAGYDPQVTQDAEGMSTYTLDIQ